MKHARMATLLILLISVVGLSIVFASPATPPSQAQLEKQARKLRQQGNYKDALAIFSKLALSADTKSPGDNFDAAIACLRQLGQYDQVDTFRQSVIAKHPRNWQLLWRAARTLIGGNSTGYIISGQFRRGPHRGGGRRVSSIARDRVRALQLMTRAMTLIGDKKNSQVGRFYTELAGMVNRHGDSRQSWRLQYLTDLSGLPDYEEIRYHRGSGTLGAPVDAAGNPVFYYQPANWKAAKNDGERWRWALAEAARRDPHLKPRATRALADFLYSQFGVQTIASYGGGFFGRYSEAENSASPQKTGTWELHTLKENETIAKLASGVKRLTLPAEFDYIKMYRQLARDKQGLQSSSLRQLCRIFENRRQYTKAARLWRRTIKQCGPGTNNSHVKRLRQIVGNWCMFEPVLTQPAGAGATVQLRFRNGKKVHFTAHKIKIEKLLQDVKSYLKSQPEKRPWRETQVENLGYRLVHQNQKKYLGKQVANWSMELEPRAGHFDKRITVATPLQKGGAYLLRAKMASGNTSFIVLWLADTAIVSKRLDKKQQMYFVADAITGEPIVGANVEFFGWQNRRQWENKKRLSTWEFANFAEFTNADGQVVLGEKQQPRGLSWLVMARTKAGRLAYMGFSGVWHGRWHERNYDSVKTFIMTDRPVYRPGQKVKFRFWVNRARYGAKGLSPLAGQRVQLVAKNPRGEKIFTKTFKLDRFGGSGGELELEAKAMLGAYRLETETENGSWHGRLSFRVEEYKKPEFEVTVKAPGEPVALGEKIAVKIQAKYYFGSPVTDAKVKYKVMRTRADANWYPPGRWDWLFGSGYWWFGYDYPWLKGWGNWGCGRPWPWWHRWRPRPRPELVAENTVQIGPDGLAEISIDTSLAKAIHPDKDHKYAITVEVTDKSRRTIVGAGSVLVARQPFKVYAWVRRGFYRLGDTVQASFQARRLDGAGVAGAGTARLMKITYKDGKPAEQEVQRWKLATDKAGLAKLKIKASRPGQYRLSYKLRDAKGHVEEGGYVFTVWGQGDVGDSYRFAALEITPDKKHYAPGDKVRLRISTDRPGGTVMLFLRPSGGVYLRPKMLRLTGKSTVETIDVSIKDMPNFFVEAVAIADGEVHTECRQIVVPPAKRVLKVEVQTDEIKCSTAAPGCENVGKAEKNLGKMPTPRYKPGQRAKVKVRLLDAAGMPVVGSVVITMYDKALEYISGGGNVPNIKEFFWKWKRHHSPQGQNNLARHTGNLVKPKAERMGNIGIFGQGAAGEPGPENRIKTMSRKKFKGSPTRATFFASQSRGVLPMAAMDASKSSVMKEDAAAAMGGGQQVAPTVRTKFADTALWVGEVTTGPDGLAQVEVTMPENLTTWKTIAWAMSAGCRVGQGAAEAVTTKNVIVRLQAPRFFIQGDEVVLSANVHNYLKTKKTAKVTLELPKGILGLIEHKLGHESVRTVEVPAGGEVRVDWRVKVLREGQAKITVKATTDEESDAMAMTMPVYVHGMLKTESFCGVIRPDEKAATVNINIPAERRPEATRLEIRYSPTLAGAMMDALPYLIEYPYGCTEQTLNRFLPAVITQQTLKKTGVDLSALEKQITNLNAQEIGDDAKRRKDWQRLCGTMKWDGKTWVKRNPVFSQAELGSVVKTSLAMLTSMQNFDGGWGWFSGGGQSSYPHTTALVVRGLLIARDNGVAIVPGVLQRGVDWLKQHQAEQLRRLKLWENGKHDWPAKSQPSNLDAMVYNVLVGGKVDSPQMRERLYRDRLKLSVYSLALLGEACHKIGDIQKRDMLVKNIGQYLVQDDENQSAWLKLPRSNWWRWYGSENEAMAWYLKLLCLTEPRGKVASGLVKYLLNNRRHGTYWNSTRDTAYCVEAFADYLQASGEDEPNMTVEILIDGQLAKSVKIDKSNPLTFDNKLVLEGLALSTGEHTITIRRKGSGPVYFNAYLTNFTLQDPIGKAGLEIKVTRKYYKLQPVKKAIKVAGGHGQAVSQRVEKYKRVPLPTPFDKSGKKIPLLKSGDLVEIELSIESKNDYEYIMLEDIKAAGFEPVDLRSGYGDNDMRAYMELRDERVTFFIRKLARGQHSLRYRMRAEIPGKFSALPTKASAMYAPELKANSNEMKVSIED